MCSDNTVYPFCAVVGQERAKKALILHAVNPSLHGVLLVGETGTAKTTLVQGFAAMFPERRRVSIPLHVDDDRLLGGVETAASVRSGRLRYASGLLAEADGHIVTVDDANRMNDRTMRAILSASEDRGRETERDGIPVWQPSSFLLLGTMNPAEAEMEPALLDRWGMHVQVTSSKETAERAEIARRRLYFERDPVAFVCEFDKAARELRDQISMARERLSIVRIGDTMLQLAAEISAEAGCEGHRAEILLIEAARALAALEGRQVTISSDLREAAEFVVPHRMLPKTEDSERDASMPEQNREHSRINREPSPSPEEREPSQSGEGGGAEGPPSGEIGDLPHGNGQAGGPREDERGDEPAPGNESEPRAVAQAVVEAIGQDFSVRSFSFAPPRTRQQARAGKRNQASEGTRSGRYVRAQPPVGPISDIALDATLRAAAPFQGLRRSLLKQQGSESEIRSPRVLVERSDVRVKVRESKTGTALLFVVDASGSMNAAKRMKEVKGAVLSLLRDAYRQRDSVGLIAFREKGAALLLDITRSVELAERRLRSMPVGGRTPLVTGLKKGVETIESLQRKRSGHIPAMIVITDGKANAGEGSGGDPWREIRRIGQRISAAGIRTLIIDSEQGFVRLGYARRLADCLGAQYCRLEEMKASRIEKAVRKMSVAKM